MAIVHLSSLCFLYTLFITWLCFPSYRIRTNALAPPPPPTNLTCAASHCGTLSNISFPFAITGPANMSTSSCGLPEFRLICNNTNISWWPEHLPLPLSSILTITANQIISGTFVAGPPPFSSPLDACSPLQEHDLFSSPPPFGLHFFPQDNIRLLTNCSQKLTHGLQVNETVDGFSFSSPSCLQYYSVCSNRISSMVPCLEAISAEANLSLVSQRYGCLNTIALYELPKKKNRGLSLQISWTISQSYYDCKACERSNGSCTLDNTTNSFQCLCADDGSASGSPSTICSSGKTLKCMVYQN